MTNKGSLKLDEGDVPVEVAPMPITMLYVMPSEITLEVVKLLGKAKKVTYCISALSIGFSALATFLTADKFCDFILSPDAWRSLFFLVGAGGLSSGLIFFLYLNWKKEFSIDPEEVANNLLEKAKRTKTVKPIQQADTTEL